MEKPIYIKKIKISGGKMLLHIEAPEKPENLHAVLSFQNSWLSTSKSIPLSRSGNVILCQIDTSLLDANSGDWELTIQDPQNGLMYLPVLSSRVRLALLLGRHYVCRSGFIFFPMGGNSHRLLLRVRPKQIYDKLSFRLKELSAFAVYRIFGKFLQKKHIWLVYEKFCITAQENGFYFFEYCMEHGRKNVYFILDKSSSQWETLQKYSKNVIPFLSFRHILYLMASDLFVSPDGRYHAYAWKPMPNPVTREISRKDIFFLQHGVTALKKVDHLFGVNGSSPMTYFVTTSEYEQNIVVKYLGYDPGHAPVLGFARWDALEDRSDPRHPMILMMPTWRSWLEGQNDENFVHSEYYKHYASLLNDPALRNVLKSNSIRLVFYIHPKLKEFISTFHSPDPQIELVSFNSRPLNQLIMECSMMITDYSSACWDAYYQGKPILFYQFDLEQYNAVNGSYLDMESELFGERCTTQEELVSLICRYAEDHLHEDPGYAAMRKTYFAYQDHDNCKRIYEFIKDQGY